MNNSYKKAMDKIELSDELKDKIINNTSKPQENKIYKFNPVSIRRLAGLAACFVFCFLSYYAVNDNQVHVASPKHEVATKDNSPAIDNDLPAFSKGKVSTENNSDTVIQKSSVVEVSAVLGYEIQSPQDAPEGYEVSNISVVDNSIAEITYQGENDIITYRTAKSSKDLSQNDNAYGFMEIVNVNNIDIVLKGNEELYYNAVWFANAESFSITSENGIEKDIMVDMVSSVDYTEPTDTDNEN